MRCFDENELIELLHGGTSASQLGEFNEHLDSCSYCRAVVAELVRATPDGSDRDAVPIDHPVDADFTYALELEPAPPLDLIPWWDRRLEGAPTTEVAGITLAPGQIVAQRHRLERPLGEGGTGVVWAATHLLLNKPVALKFLKTVGADAVRRFLREGRIITALRHPHIVEVTDVFELPDGGGPVMVMELLEGESFGARLRREPKLPLGDVLDVLIPVTSAVSAAHAAGIVHRDLKPENIFLVRGADGRITVKVLDFGLAKVPTTDGGVIRTSNPTRRGVLVGTPYYMAPEQILVDGVVDHRADIWSLGVIAYRALAGRRPIEGKSLGPLLKAITLGVIPPLESLVPELPRAATSLVGRMLARAPEDRPSDLGEVHAALMALTTTHSVK